MIRILVVDDQRTVQKIIENYLDSEDDLKVVGFANDGKSAIEKAEELQPDVVLMDIEMPGMDGLSATKIIADRYVNTKVVILTLNDNNEEYLKQALNVGAKGYLLKTTSADEIIEAIRNAYKGYFQLGPGLLEKYLHQALKAQTNADEITQLKEIIQSQSRILEKINDESVAQEIIEKKLDNSQFFAELKNIQFEFRNVKKRISHVEQELSFFRKFLLIFVLIITITVVVRLILAR